MSAPYVLLAITSTIISVSHALREELNINFSRAGVWCWSIVVCYGSSHPARWFLVRKCCSLLTTPGWIRVVRWCLRRMRRLWMKAHQRAKMMEWGPEIKRIGAFKLGRSGRRMWWWSRYPSRRWLWCGGWLLCYVLSPCCFACYCSSITCCSKWAWK